MADEIRRMQNYTASDINDNVAEVRTARGTFDTLDDRLDNIEGGGPSPSSDTPAMDGTGAAGTADTYARGDHVHPTDTSRQAAIDSSHPIASNCVSPMTGYSKSSSSTPGNISTDDTLNAAIGKLEKRTELNETNILLSEQMNGAKNLLEVTLTSGAQSNLATATVNADKTITVNRSSANSSSATFVIGKLQTESGEQYVVSGAPSGSSSTTYRIVVEGFGYDYGSGYTFTGNGNLVNIVAEIRPNVTCSNLVFKPMIVSKAINDAGYTDFQPYSMSNVELTANISSLSAYIVPEMPSGNLTDSNVERDYNCRIVGYAMNTDLAGRGGWVYVDTIILNIEGSRRMQKSYFSDGVTKTRFYGANGWESWA